MRQVIHFVDSHPQNIEQKVRIIRLEPMTASGGAVKTEEPLDFLSEIVQEFWRDYAGRVG